MEKKSTISTFAELFLVFVMIGGTTFGGGYAMLPILQREIVEKRHWATDEELMDYYAIGQCTPGIIAVNTSTFIGYKLLGIPGAIVAGIGMITPSLFIITIIAMFLRNFADIPAVQHALTGIRAAVCVLIFDSVMKLAKKSLKDNFCVIIFLVILAVSLFSGVSPLWLVLFAGLAGYLLKPVADKKAAQKEEKKGEDKKC